nr:ATP-binding protein [Salsipaludibacter albus]
MARRAADRAEDGAETPPGRPDWLTSSARTWWGLAVAFVLPVVFALVLMPFRDTVEGAVFGLLMLVPTTLAAAIGGPVPAAVAVVVGSTAHNLMFTQPYMTLRVADTTDVTGLVVHIVVAVVVSLVVVREQRAARRAETREEAAARVRLLEEVDRVRTAILGAVSHDLRTPLAAIAAAGSELQASDVAFSDDDRAVLAATITEQARRLDRTVANLLDAGRLEAGQVDVQSEAVDVRDLVEECLAGVPDATTHRVTVEVQPGTPPLWVDPVLIESALRNLVDNALRHSPPDHPVEVSAFPAGGGVALTVRDHGPGLPPTDDDHLFDAFQTRRDGGIGLGLAICAGFVAAHGGSIDVVTGPDGSCFELVLPAVPEPDE